MFRQTPFTQSDLARSIVARETATKVRYFDPKTARMSGWMPKPAQATDTALKGLAAALAETVTASHPAIQGAMRRKYGAMPVAQLRTLASESGVKNASRMRKADIIEALTA
jgi:hypothetical protein